MTTRSKLMLMAAALAPLPLYAQQPETVPAPAPAVVETATQVPSAAAKRAEVLAPLASIPKDADFAVVLTNPLKRFGWLEDIPEEAPFLADVTNLAAASGKGFSTNLANIYELIILACYSEHKVELVKGWETFAKAELKGVLENAAKDIPARDQQKFVDTLAQFKLHPYYGVTSFSKDDSAKAAAEEVLKSMKEACEDDDDLEFVTVGNFAGIKFHSDLKEADTDEEFSFLDAVTNECRKRTPHVLVAVEGGNLIFVACEDPEEISIPTKPEDSILDAPALASVDGNLADELVFAGYASPEMVEAGYAGTRALCDAAGAFASIFDKMADSDAQSDALKAAAAAIRSLTAQVGDMLIPVEKPLFCKVWGTPGAYHAELTCDACGYEFAPGKLALAAKAGNADTILCVETTPIKCNIPVDFNKLGTAYINLYNGIIASLAPELQQLVNGQLQQALEFLPEAADACKALASICCGIGGTAGVVVDGKGEAPAFLTQGEEASMPRVAIYSGVKDRAKLAEGWDGLLKVTGDVLEKCGQSRAMLAMIPIVPAPVGDAAMSYSVVVPGILTPDLGVNVTVSDTAFAAGTSAKLNEEIVTTANADQDFAGVTFVLNTQPLATTVRSLADAMTKAVGPFKTERHYFDEDEDVSPAKVEAESEEEEPAPEVAPAEEEKPGCGCGDCKLDENGECICSEDKEDEEDEECDDETDDSDDVYDSCSYRFRIGKDENGRGYYEEVRLTPEQEQAYEVDGYAKNLEDLAKNVKAIKGDITIKEGVETIRVDIDLNK